MVSGIPFLPICLDVCRTCQLRKQHQELFPRNQICATTINELIHFNICEPFLIRSLGGSFYIMTFLDDYFHKVWVFFLKRKSEALKIFKIFKIFNERLIGHPIKVLCLDRGKF
jgi:hypothetical protein